MTDLEIMKALVAGEKITIKDENCDAYVYLNKEGHLVNHAGLPLGHPLAYFKYRSRNELRIWIEPKKTVKMAPYYYEREGSRPCMTTRLFQDDQAFLFDIQRGRLVPETANKIKWYKRCSALETEVEV